MQVLPRLEVYDLFQNHHSALDLFLPISLCLLFPWMCKTDDDVEEQHYHTLKKGKVSRTEMTEDCPGHSAKCFCLSDFQDLVKKKIPQKPMEISPAKVCWRNEVNRRNTQLAVFCGWMWCASWDSGSCCASGKRREA